jgi:hypothetical protein
MHLVSLSNKIRPITLSLGIGVLATTSSFAYSDIDAFSGISSITTNNRTSEYLNTVDRNDFGYLMQKLKFQNHLIKWQNGVAFLSSTKAIIENRDFQAIISMGVSVVPFIIEEIESKPSILVWALNLIYDHKITNDPCATITEACKLWAKELKK